MNAERRARALGQLHEVTVSVTENARWNNFRYKCTFQNYPPANRGSSAQTADAAWQAVCDIIESKIKPTAKDGPSTVVQFNSKAAARRARAAAAATTATVTAAPHLRWQGALKAGVRDVSTGTWPWE